LEASDGICYLDVAGVAATLEQLWISYNSIGSLSGLERCQETEEDQT